MLTTRPCTSLRTSFLFPSTSSSQFSFDMATFSGLRDQNFSHDTPLKNSTVASTVLRQVIGFNPSGKGLSTLDSVVSTTFHGPAQRKVSARGPISPRSALQDLLAAAREGVSSKGVKISTCCLPEKPNEVMSETRQQAGHATDSDDLQSLNTWQIVEAQIGTGLEQSPQSLQRTKAIGFAAVLVESSDNPRSFFQNLRMSDTREYRHQHAPASKACRQQQYGRNSLFLRLATSPSTSDHCTDPALSMDFLNSCYLCRRRLAQGRDVFMYNGDKAFCSEECRYQQIVMDERKEKGPPAVIRSGSSAGEPHHTGHHQARCKNQTAAAA